MRVERGSLEKRRLAGLAVEAEEEDSAEEEEEEEEELSGKSARRGLLYKEESNIAQKLDY